MKKWNRGHNLHNGLVCGFVQMFFDLIIFFLLQLRKGLSKEGLPQDNQRSEKGNFKAYAKNMYVYS